MHLLTVEQLNEVMGGYAVMSGPFSVGPNGMVFQDGFYIEVTDKSSNVLGNFAAYPNKVIDLNTKEVLFDGSQSSFCINGSLFIVSDVNGGHRYTYAGQC